MAMAFYCCHPVAQAVHLSKLAVAKAAVTEALESHYDTVFMPTC